MLLIVDPQGNINDNYFEDRPDNLHYKIYRNYINNISIDFSLKYDLALADKKAKEQGRGVEIRLNELMKIFVKNGYMILMDTTDYRQYKTGEKHYGGVVLPTTMDYLSNTHKQTLNQISSEIIVDATCQYKNIDKIVYFQLSVFYYDKNLKEISEVSPDFNEVLYELHHPSKNVK